MFSPKSCSFKQNCFHLVCVTASHRTSFLIIFSHTLSDLPRFSFMATENLRIKFTNAILHPFGALQEVSFWVVTDTCKGPYSFDYLCWLKKKLSWFFPYFEMKISDKSKQSTEKTVTFYLQYSQIVFLKYGGLFYFEICGAFWVKIFFQY